MIMYTVQHVTVRYYIIITSAKTPSLPISTINHDLLHILLQMPNSKSLPVYVASFPVEAQSPLYGTIPFHSHCTAPFPLSQHGGPPLVSAGIHCLPSTSVVGCSSVTIKKAVGASWPHLCCPPNGGSDEIHLKMNHTMNHTMNLIRREVQTYHFLSVLPTYSVIQLLTLRLLQYRLQLNFL